MNDKSIEEICCLAAVRVGHVLYKLSAIHSWPCHSFSVDCSYNFDLMTNVAGVDLFTGQH